jgi:Arc/MetJ-type ribon-helix-helix transcriptional regulator
MAKRNQVRSEVILEGLRNLKTPFGEQLYNNAVKHVLFMKTAKAEAEHLFEALHGADLWHVMRYVEQHRPSPAAIGWLILVARDKFQSEHNKGAAEAPRRDALRTLLEDIDQRKPRLSHKRVWRELEREVGKGVIVSVTDDGIEWRSKSGRLRRTSIDALASRLSRIRDGQAAKG